MPTVTVAAIQERVRQLCDLPAYSTDTPITSACILDFVGVAANLLGALVKEASAELYFATSTEITTLAGVQLVSVPDGFSDLIRLSWQKSASQDIPLEVAISDDFEAYPSAWGTCTPRYRLIGQTIELFPTPDAAYTLKAYFSTGLTPTSPTDTLVLRDGWDLWIALQTGILVRVRQQKDYSDLTTLIGKVEGDIRRQLKRDRFGVRQVRDLRHVYGPTARRHGRWY